jgi:hypothetical protein
MFQEKQRACRDYRKEKTGSSTPVFATQALLRFPLQSDTIQPSVPALEAGLLRLPHCMSLQVKKASRITTAI